MATPLEGKIALVTGATRGIGRSIAERLIDAGSNVVICSPRPEAVTKAVAELAARGGAGRVAGQGCDVADYEDVRALFQFVGQTFAGLDILVNNAGIGFFQPVDQITPQDWRRLIDTNLTGSFYCTREAVPLMRRRGGGYIFNIGSLAGKNPLPGGTAYNASKFGLLGFSEAAMLDLRYDNIRVTSIMPGSVATEFAGQAPATDWKIHPSDIAETVVNLLLLPDRALASRVEMRPTRPPRM
jgi:NAD(P)-dependent dehydrogenase (short-subunit alcohol dehydrogenase family)